MLLSVEGVCSLELVGRSVITGRLFIGVGWLIGRPVGWLLLGDCSLELGGWSVGESVIIGRLFTLLITHHILSAGSLRHNAGKCQLTHSVCLHCSVEHEDTQVRRGSAWPFRRGVCC